MTRPPAGRAECLRGEKGKPRKRSGSAGGVHAEILPLLATGSYNCGKLERDKLFCPAGQQPPTVNINGNRLGGSIFAGVTIPLYDGGTRDAQLARALGQKPTAPMLA